MASRQVGLRDVARGRKKSRMRLLAPVRYLAIYHSEKSRYDVFYPLVVGIIGWILFMCANPRPPIFGDDSVLKLTRDFLTMAVPFLIGALAGVAMGVPGPHFDRRPLGEDVYLGDEALTLRQFMCYLLGYLCFLSLLLLFASILAELFRLPVQIMLEKIPYLSEAFFLLSTLILSITISALSITVLWALYFLTDIVNRPSRDL